jgi:thioredoxin-like negative regulator of GroEL
MRKNTSLVKPSVAKLTEPSKVKALRNEPTSEQKISAKPPVKPQLIEPLLEEQSVEADETTRVVDQESQSSCEDTTAEQRSARTATDPSDKLLHLRKALRLCPNNATLHHELGKVYSSMNRSADATDEFLEALKVDPTFSAAKVALNELKTAEVDQRF